MALQKMMYESKDEEVIHVHLRHVSNLHIARLDFISRNTPGVPWPG